MANKTNQVAVIDQGNKQVESESTEETTLTEIHKDLGHTKSLEKKAEFEEHNKESVIEDHRSQKSESNRQVTQSVKHEESTDGRKTEASGDDFLKSTLLKPFNPIEPFRTSNVTEESRISTETQVREQENQQINENRDETNSTIKVDTNNSEEYKLPDFYKPVEILTPLELEEFMYNETKEVEATEKQTLNEYKSKKIENSLLEIISDLDQYTEKEMKSKDSENILLEHSEYQDENSSNAINVKKILTPAEGSELKMAPKKKMFANSAFYAKGLHPTMEEQVELAKRISSSLSDISNQTSKGQSMYVNRKKRSVKWVHEGEGGVTNGSENNLRGGSFEKNPLKLVMNPHGQIQDINSLGKQGYKFESALSPDICLSIVKDLNSPKGKGAELFAKRRKRSEKWVVEEKSETKRVSETSTSTASNSFQTQTALPYKYSSPQTNNSVQSKETLLRPRVKLIKSPWESALETGSVEGAFESYPLLGVSKGNFVEPTVHSFENTFTTNNLASSKGIGQNGHVHQNKIFAHNPAYNSESINRAVENLNRGVSNVDVYKPTLPAAWNSRRLTTTSSSQQCLYKENDSDINSYEFSEAQQSENDKSLTEYSESEPINNPPDEFSFEIQTATLESTDEAKNDSSKTTESIQNMEEESVEKSLEQDQKEIIFISPSISTLENNHSEDTKNYKPFSFQYRPLSSQDSPNTWQPTQCTSKNATKPEFGFALDSESRVIENSFSNSSSNSLTLASAKFQSQGHFVAERSKSPLPIFIPQSDCFQEELSENLTVSIQPFVQYMGEETKNPVYEDNVRSMVLLGNQEKKNVIQNQKSCFSELQEIEEAYRVANYPSLGMKEISTAEKIHDFNHHQQENNLKFNPENTHNGRSKSPIDMTNENSEYNENLSNSIASVVCEDETYAKNVKKDVDGGLGNEEKEYLGTDSPSKTTELTKEHENTTTTSSSHFDERDKISKPFCKKAPQAVIGARPLFGQLDINKEFMKAFTGKEKLMRTKRDREIFQCTPKTSTKVPKKRKDISAMESTYKSDLVGNQNKHDTSVNRVVTEQNSRQELDKCLTGESRNSSRITGVIENNQISDIEIIRPNEAEEIEKIYYEQERAYNIDFQTIGEELSQSDIQTIIDREISSRTTNTSNSVFQKCLSELEDTEHVQSVNCKYESFYNIRSEDGHRQYNEEYQKVPVRSIIENFEQSSMPPLKIKEQNIPSSLTDRNKFSESLSSQSFFGSEGKQASPSVNNEKVQDLQMKQKESSPKLKKEGLFQHSANSSFCEYDQKQIFPKEDFADACYLAVTKIDPAFACNKEISQGTLPREISRPMFNTSVAHGGYEQKEGIASQFIPPEYSPTYSNNNAPIRSVVAPEPIKKFDFQSLHNYNTAPRGWTRNENVYRPITFSNSYSDF